MVGWPFGKKPPQMTELGQSVGNGVAQMAAGKQSSETEQQKRLLENDVIMVDRNLQELHRGMSQTTYTDTEGLIGEAGEQYTYANPKNVAISILMSPLIRTGFISEKDARIAKWQTHRLFTRRGMQFSEEEFEEGGKLVLDADNMIVDNNINGSINGRITKLVKLNHSGIDVTVGPPPQQRGQP